MTDIEIPEGFTRWDGETSYGPRIELLLRDGRTCISRDIAGWKWRHENARYDIIAYRVLP